MMAATGRHDMALAYAVFWYKERNIYTCQSDIENNTATIISWIRSDGNVIYKYIVHEDKTVEELADEYRLIPEDPIRITVVSGNHCSYSATELKNIIQNNKWKLVPFIYLIKDGLVYSLVFYQLDDAGTGNLFRFACVTDTAIKFAYITEKEI